MKKQFIIAFLMLTVTCVAQEDNKGTIKVKKIPETPRTIDTASFYSQKSQTLIFYDTTPHISYGLRYDRRPEFPGDFGAQESFVDKIRIFPDFYKCKGTTVVSRLTMLVRKDGSLTDIIMNKGAENCAKCDEEAIRIVKQMPNWKPAELKGEKIDLKWDIDIRFTYLK